MSELDTYFTMARGYQGKAGDVKALAMKKWFNTNYHYIVPEVEDDTVISFSGKKISSEFEEAKELRISVKPVVPGAYSLLKLCRYTGTKTTEDFADDVILAYKELLKLCDKNEVSWIQFDEPSLVFDMTEQDLALFRKIYSEILPSAQSCQVLVQTYFGDVRDVYQDLIQLPFAGVGLDFVEGKQTKKLIEQYGFPKDKILFAGLVNGKNIWKNHYKETLQALQELKEKGIHTVLSTSCSLLHVPYTIEQEKELSDEYKKHFAFAKEKLSELRDLKVLEEDENVLSSVLLKANESLFLEGRDCVKDEVKNRLKQVKDEDYVRTPARKERQKRQKEVLGLPIFPTTTIGSFPQTKDVKANRSAYRRGEKTKEEYVAFNREKISECIRWQEEIGLDVLVHGEYERNDMVEYFGESLGGFLFTKLGWVQSYGTRCVKPPIIWGDVYRDKPITVAWSVFAQSQTDKIMKGMLTGPVTILNWSFPREDISIGESMMQIAFVIRDEVLDLEKNGIRMIQIDEASRSDLQILDALRDNHFETEVGPGVYDIHSARVPSVEEIVTALKGMLEKIEPDKLWVNPDCGLKTRGVKETDASLRNMVAAAKEIR